MLHCSFLWDLFPSSLHSPCGLFYADYSHQSRGMPITVRRALAIPHTHHSRHGRNGSPMVNKHLASAIRASSREVIRVAREAAADSREARAQAEERIQETKALVKRVHADRERWRLKSLP